MAKKSKQKTYKELLRHSHKYQPDEKAGNLESHDSKETRSAVVSREKNTGKDESRQMQYLRSDLLKSAKYLIAALVILGISAILISDFAFAENIREIIGISQVTF